MKLTWDGSQFLALNAFAFREELKAWRFEWRPDLGAWATTSPKAAAHFRAHADADAENKITRSFITVSPWVGRIPYLKGLKPLAYQIPAANFILARNHSYAALDPGLGKTIVMALVINALGKHPVVVVCPSGLCLNIEREIKKWLTWKARISIYNPQKKLADHSDILLVPDVFLADPLGVYDLLRDRLRSMVAIGGASLFVDEAQRFGDFAAQRTMALLGATGIAHGFDRVCFLSGTPLRKRPISLYPILSTFAGETIDFASKHDYGMKYCGGRWDGYAWDYSGASHFVELAQKIRDKFMLRIRKKDVLKDLPPKTEELLFLDEKAPPMVAKFEQKYLAKYSPLELKREAKHENGERQRNAELGKVAKYLKMIGLAKCKLAIPHIKDTLDWGDESILIVANHRAVLEKLMDALKSYKPLLVYGSTPRKMKQVQVDAFQEGLSRVFIIQTQCAVGFNLTMASRVIAVESSWVETDNEQAEDRAHRIGQVNPVFIQRLCFKNSMDRKVLESNLKTRQLTALL